MFLFNNNVQTRDWFSSRMSKIRNNGAKHVQMNNIQCSVNKWSSHGSKSSMLLNSVNNGCMSGISSNNGYYIGYSDVSGSQSYIDQLTQYNQYLQQQLILTQNKLLDYNLNMQYQTQSCPSQIQNVNCMQGVGVTGAVGDGIIGVKQMLASTSPIYYSSLMGCYKGINESNIGIANNSYLNVGVCSDSTNNLVRNFNGNTVMENRGNIQGECYCSEYDILLLPMCENKLTVKDVSHSELSLKSSLKKEDSEVEVIIKNGDKKVELDCLRDELLSENKIHCDKKFASELEVDVYENEKDLNNLGSYHLKHEKTNSENTNNFQIKLENNYNGNQFVFASEEICQELVFDFVNDGNESNSNEKGASKHDENNDKEKRKGEIEIDEDSLLIIKYKNNERMGQDVLDIIEGNMSNFVIDGNSYYNESIICGYQTCNNNMFTIDNCPEIIEIINGNVLGAEVGSGNEFEPVREERINITQITPLEYVTNSKVEIEVPIEPKIQELQEYNYYNVEKEESEDETNQLFNDNIGRYNLLLEKINKIEEMNILIKQVVLKEKRRYYDEMNAMEGKKNSENKGTKEDCYLNENEIDVLGSRDSFDTIRDDYKSNSTGLFCDDKDETIKMPDEGYTDEINIINESVENNETEKNVNDERSEYFDKRTADKNNIEDGCDEDCGSISYIRDQIDSVDLENEFKGSEEQMEIYIKTINSYFSSQGPESSCESILNTQRWERKYQTAMNSLNDQIKQQENEENGNEYNILKVRNTVENNDNNVSTKVAIRNVETEIKQDDLGDICKRTENKIVTNNNSFEIVKENGLVIMDSSANVSSESSSKKTKNNIFISSPLHIEEKTEITNASGSQSNLKKDNEILERLSQCRVINSKSIRNSTTSTSSKPTNTDLSSSNCSDSIKAEMKSYEAQNLGFRSLINNGIKLKVSDLVKPRTIKKKL
ncbi:hypothetical protein FG379_001504 [Cryptosporidium bovis]|uniref:uncharacterized protein n=1 Tax=Cryptosporidium bovis TaxID=310047 RepID=UPI00351A8551|nr:hypothetical protein FG379_001504 [Cryptosporidium bovis]